MEILAFRTGQHAVGFVRAFLLANFFLVATQFLGFILGQLAGADALFNAILLTMLARVYARVAGVFTSLVLGRAIGVGRAKEER